MTERYCLWRDCYVTTPKTYCTRHARRLDRARGTTTERGYGAPHQRAREDLAATLPTPCGYGCGTLLRPDRPWVAAHVVDGAPEHGYLASCVACNAQRQRRPGGGSNRSSVVEP